MLKDEISASTEENNKINDNFGNRENMHTFKKNGVQKIDSINAIVDTRVIISMMESLIILTITSSAVAIFSINRFKPLTILKERG